MDECTQLVIKVLQYIFLSSNTILMDICQMLLLQLRYNIYSVLNELIFTCGLICPHLSNQLLLIALITVSPSANQRLYYISGLPFNLPNTGENIITSYPAKSEFAKDYHDNAFAQYLKIAHMQAVHCCKFCFAFTVAGKDVVPFEVKTTLQQKNQFSKVITFIT